MLQCVTQTDVDFPDLRESRTRTLDEAKGPKLEVGAGRGLPEQGSRQRRCGVSLIDIVLYNQALVKHGLVVGLVLVGIVGVEGVCLRSSPSSSSAGLPLSIKHMQPTAATLIYKPSTPSIADRGCNAG